MKIAVITDIHANYNNLIKVLDAIENVGVDQIYCLGDIVGYGAQPEKVIEEIRKRNIHAVYGNHDRALFDEMTWFIMNDIAQESLNINHDLLSDDALNYLENLPPFLVNDNMRFLHGAPPDSHLIYLSHLFNDDIRNALLKIPEKLVFCGHTHSSALYVYDWKRVRRKDNIEYNLPYKIENRKRYIVNVGSVSEYRGKGGHISQYVIYDKEYQTITIKFS